MRLYEYAKKLNKKSKEIISTLRAMNFIVNSHMIEMSDEMINSLESEKEIKSAELTKDINKIKVLYAVSECTPFVKTGGLADVAGSLPKYLNREGLDVRVILPKYGLIDDVYKDKMKSMAELVVNVGWREAYCGLQYLELDGVTYYFIDNEYYFNRDALYGQYDDGERFAFFNRAILEVIPYLDFLPNIIHINDWHTSMVPLMYKVDYSWLEEYVNIKTVLTIHNLQYQGWFPSEVLTDLCNLSNEYFHDGTTRMDDMVNFLKTGIETADYITTVSPSYAEEIKDFYFGEGLHNVIRGNEDHIQGILNGIDIDVFNPSTDDSIYKNYSLESIENKVQNKTKLQKYFKLKVDKDVPLVGMVCRLVDQKGLDLVMSEFDEIMKEDIQFIMLGSGDKRYEQFFQDMELKYSKKFKAYIGYNTDLAQKIYAGSDLFLMPSLFEPCGLGQLIAMRYGTIPIVREIGGLKDTVKPYNDYKKTGNGFSFVNYDAEEMLEMIKYALKIFKNKGNREILVKNAMEIDFSWNKSASSYIELYKELIK